MALKFVSSCNFFTPLGYMYVNDLCYFQCSFFFHISKMFTTSHFQGRTDMSNNSLSYRAKTYVNGNFSWYIANRLFQGLINLVLNTEFSTYIVNNSFACFLCRQHG